jgi:hypothetical protein
MSIELLVRPTAVLRGDMQRLLDRMDTVPAFVLGRRTDILAWNALGDAVRSVSALPREHRNPA